MWSYWEDANKKASEISEKMDEYLDQDEAVSYGRMALDDLLNEYSGKILVDNEGSLEPLYEMPFLAKIVGLDGVVKVGSEYWQIYNDGIAKSTTRDFPEIVSEKRLAPQEFPQGVEFTKFKLIKPKNVPSHSRDFENICTNRDFVANLRVKGNFGGFIFDHPTIWEVNLEARTRFQKRTLGIWWAKIAEEIRADGQTQILHNGWEYLTTIDLPVIILVDANSVSTFDELFLSKSFTNVDHGWGWGFHHAKDGSFDRSCTNDGN